MIKKCQKWVQNHKIKVTLSSFFLFLLLLFVICTYSYSYFNYSVSGTVKNKITTGTYISPGIQKVASSNYNEEMWQYKSNITKIVFQNQIQEMDNAAYTYDISSRNDNSIIANLVANSDDTSTYTAYIQSNGNVLANEDSSYLFYGFKNLATLEGVEYFDTANVTDMKSMFQNCSSLTSIDLSNFVTPNLTNMHLCFMDVHQLRLLILVN